MRLASILSVAILAAALPAAASTIHVANSCSGVPTPCTTNLQSALDNTRYAIVQTEANTTFTGDYRINRSMTLTGGSNSALQLGSGKTWTLRVESTSNVTISGLTVTGRIAVYNASDVTFDTVDVSSGTVGFQITGSSSVTLDTCTASNSDRAVDAQDSTTVLITRGSYDGTTNYAVVISSSTVTVTSADMYGADHTFIAQQGNGSTTPTLSASDSTLTTTTGHTTTYKWTGASTSYTSCTPTPTESTTSNTRPVSLVSYTPWGGP